MTPCPVPRCYLSRAGRSAPLLSSMAVARQSCVLRRRVMAFDGIPWTYYHLCREVSNMGIASRANWNARVARLRLADVQLIKLSVAGFILMVARLWPPLLGLDWYWYAVIGVLAAVRPGYRVLAK